MNYSIPHLIGYWLLFMALILISIIIIYGVYVFIKMPSDEQLNKVREWLLYAVTQAEKDLGGGTGKIKLRYVYDKFLTKFPYLTSVIPFELFSSLVDEALVKFREILETNDKVQEYVEGKIIWFRRTYRWS